MAYQENERTLSGDIPISDWDTFDLQVESRGQVKKKSLAAAVRLWISLDADTQSALLDKKTTSSAFIELVNQIVDARIASGFQDALDKDLHRKKKHGLKD